VESSTRAVHELLLAAGATIAVAESLTGGAFGAELTSVPGSSATFLGGITAYATAAKASLLGVDPDLLARHGAVNPEVAAAMARGVRERFGSTYAVALTGVAGPDPQDGQQPGTWPSWVPGWSGCWRSPCPVAARRCAGRRSGPRSPWSSGSWASPSTRTGSARHDYSVTPTWRSSDVSIRRWFVPTSTVDALSARELSDQSPRDLRESP
jgi:nicotinamide-nucleotide amidase